MVCAAAGTEFSVPLGPIVQDAALALADCLLAEALPLRCIARMNIVDCIQLVE